MKMFNLSRNDVKILGIHAGAVYKSRNIINFRIYLKNNKHISRYY